MSAEKIPESEKEKVTPKPTNVFYVWYPELCRRAKTQPLSYVKPAKPKNDNVLDFVADRIKPEEWIPILNALRRDTSLHVIAIRSRAKCTFLEDVDTKEKIKTMKRRAGSLHTAFMCRSLIKTLTSCLAKSRVLSSLEFEGIPIGIEDVEVLVAALKNNKILKALTFKHCNIGNLGCQILCDALRQIPNIEVLNLTGCKLDSTSARCIAKVVKTQQISRYCESWHNSLRYEEPEVSIMAGLRRITLNNNPGIGDEGLTCILDELDDDLWIKALDMQRCGVTEGVTKRLLDVVEYSRSLEIADFRHNQLEAATIERIFDLLKEKRTFSSVSEFKWCYSTSTLSSNAIQETSSKTSIFYPAGKSKSVPIKNMATPTETSLNRIKTNTCLASSASMCTTPNFPRQPSTPGSIPRPEFQRSLTSLNSKLQRETSKRIRMEQENRKLKEELERVRSAFISVQSNISIEKERTVKFNPLPPNKKMTIKSKPEKKDELMRADHTIRPALKVELVHDKNGQENAAYDILQSLVKDKLKNTPRGTTSSEDQELSHYFRDTVKDSKRDEEQETARSDDGICSNDEGSQASLIKFMCEIKTKH